MTEREKPAGYARSEAKNAEVRATLEPLEPGERPWPLLAAIGLALFLAVANLVGTLLDESVPLGGTLLFVAVMALGIFGLWNRQAWAVLGFLALLGIMTAFAMLSLLVANNLAAVVLCVVVAGFSGTLFWKLIRVLGRIQAPGR
jgi:hypothetical protein